MEKSIKLQMSLEELNAITIDNFYLLYTSVNFFVNEDFNMMVIPIIDRLQNFLYEEASELEKLRITNASQSQDEIQIPINSKYSTIIIKINENFYDARNLLKLNFDTWEKKVVEPLKNHYTGQISFLNIDDKICLDIPVDEFIGEFNKKCEEQIHLESMHEYFTQLGKMNQPDTKYIGFTTEKSEVSKIIQIDSTKSKSHSKVFRLNPNHTNPEEKPLDE